MCYTQLQRPLYCITYLIKEKYKLVVNICFSFLANTLFFFSFFISFPSNLFIFFYDTTNIVGVWLTHVLQNA